MSKGKKANKILLNVLGILDKNTRLVADKNSFMLQERIKDTVDGWASKYYYSNLEYAIRGYAKRLARKQKRKVANSAPLMDILDLLASLETTIKDVGIKLSKEWDKLEKSNE